MRSPVSSRSKSLEVQLLETRSELAQCREELARCREEVLANKKEQENYCATLSRLRDEQESSRGHSSLSSAWQTWQAAASGDPQSSAVHHGPSVQAPISDYFPPFNPDMEPFEATLEQMIEVSENMDAVVCLYRFSEIEQGQSLRQHVQQQVDGPACPGPHIEDTLVYISPRTLKLCNFNKLEEAQVRMAAIWSGRSGVLTAQASASGYKCTPMWTDKEWRSMLKSILAGKFHPNCNYNYVLGVAGTVKSSIGVNSYMPVIVMEPDNGKRYWGMIRQCFPIPAPTIEEWAIQSTIFNQFNSFAGLTVVKRDSDTVHFQNRVSTSWFGCHGELNRKNGVISSNKQAVILSNHNHQLKFLENLFYGCKDDLEMMKQTIDQKMFSTRIEIVSPALRSLMGLRDGDVVVHDVQIIATHDPVTFEGVYHVIQIDATKEYLAQRSLKIALSDLQEEKKQADLLADRQYALIQCLGKVGKAATLHSSSEEGNGSGSDHASGSCTSAATSKLIEGVLQQMAQAASSGPSARGVKDQSESDDVKMLSVIGQGAYGKVYRGLWRGSIAAIKVMILPSNMSGSEKRERMALLEAAISTSLSHPNIVQTYTYSIKPISRSDGLDVRLIQEFCDAGSLRQALKTDAFITESGNLNYLAVLETAADIARGMAHLHQLDFLHLDLKAHNVLLKSTASNSRCIVAKIADFGLSMKMDKMDTHVSQVFNGTPTHMAPEVFLHGHQSRAVDVFAFGILLWELYTGQAVYADIPDSFLAFRISQEGLRPEFPPTAPPGYVAIAQRCWSASPKDRPDFQEVLNSLIDLRVSEGGTASWVQVQVEVWDDNDMSSVLLENSSSRGQEVEGCKLMSICQSGDILPSTLI